MNGNYPTTHPTHTNKIGIVQKHELPFAYLCLSGASVATDQANCLLSIVNSAPTKSREYHGISQSTTAHCSIVTRAGHCTFIAHSIGSKPVSTKAHDFKLTSCIEITLNKTYTPRIRFGFIANELINIYSLRISA